MINNLLTVYPISAGASERGFAELNLQ